MQFLVYHQYPKAISEKRLRAPSTREFVEIFQFVYERLDPSFPWQKLKAEEEIPARLKDMGYPFSVKPSLIISCGSPHNWPKLLGVLRWMIELTDVRPPVFFCCCKICVCVCVYVCACACMYVCVSFQKRLARSIWFTPVLMYACVSIVYAVCRGQQR